MRIYTITCQFPRNCGARLQAYALQAYLEERGNDVSIINYLPENFRRQENLWRVAGSRGDFFPLNVFLALFKLRRRLKFRKSYRYRRFAEFSEKYLHLTREYRNSLDMMNSLPARDVYLAGSDQIWNILMQNGKDGAYYLDFAPRKSVRASYAASMSMDELADEWSEQQKIWIGGLDYVSVREASSLRLLEKLGVTDGYAVVDPVFLLPQEEWLRLARDGAYKLDKFENDYVFVYDFDGSEEIKQEALRLSREHNCMIRSFYSNDYSDRVMSSAGPLEFLFLISQAKYVLSNSFHATAFSLIFHKQFGLFLRREKLNSRMRDLMLLAGLENHRIADSSIDWLMVQERLNEAVFRSKAFLEKVLEGAKGLR